VIGEAVVPWFADGLVLLGLIVMTIGIIGIARMPDVFTKIHAASKSVFLGVCSILAAVAASGEPSMIGRLVLIAALLLLTTPVAAHELAEAVARGERADGHRQATAFSRAAGRTGSPPDGPRSPSRDGSYPAPTGTRPFA
jgi:multicomponent Na+:H+ antiporter subunit G